MTADDYFAIQNLINTYFQKVDNGDFGGCGALFLHADVLYVASGKLISKDPSAIARQMRDYVKLYGADQTPLTRHHSGNIIIEPLRDNEAKANCSAVIFQATEDLQFQAIAEASYQDQFKKRDGTWVFKRRELSLNFMGDLSHHLSRAVSKK